MGQRIYFNDETITMDLPDFPPVVVDDWRIVPITYPEVAKISISIIEYRLVIFHLKITRTEVDQFRPGLSIPYCFLELRWTGGDHPHPLFYKVMLKGARPPKDYFYIRFYPRTLGKDL